MGLNLSPVVSRVRVSVVRLCVSGVYCMYVRTCACAEVSCSSIQYSPLLQIFNTVQPFLPVLSFPVMAFAVVYLVRT